MAEGSTQGTSKLLSSAKYVREGWSERPKGIVGDAQVFYNGAIAACQTDGTSTVVRLLPLPFAREGYKCTAVDLQARNQTSRYAYFYASLLGIPHPIVHGSTKHLSVISASPLPNHAAWTADTLLSSLVSFVSSFCAAPFAGRCFRFWSGSTSRGGTSLQ